MVSRYAVYGFTTDQRNDSSHRSPAAAGGRELLAEFERLETAMDFAEFYRRKYNHRKYQVCGISYNRVNVTEGGLISEYKPIPDELREEAAEDFITFLQADPY